MLEIGPHALSLLRGPPQGQGDNDVARFVKRGGGEVEERGVEVAHSQGRPQASGLSPSANRQADACSSVSTKVGSS